MMRTVNAGLTRLLRKVKRILKRKIICISSKYDSACISSNI